MLVFRLMQGICDAALVPLSQATMLDIYPIEQRAHAMAIFGMGAMLRPILGPTLGGYLTGAYSWRWVFYVNVPVGIVAITGLLIFLPNALLRPELTFDSTRFGVLAMGIGSLQLMLDRGQGQDWFSSPEIIACAVLASLELIFNPMTVMGRETSPANLRGDATTLQALSRNLGAEIGISIVTFMLTRNTQISNADIAANVTPFNRMLQDQVVAHYWNPATEIGAQILDQVINRQGGIIAHNDDDRIMTYFVVPPLFLLMLMKRPNAIGRPAPMSVVSKLAPAAALAGVRSGDD